MGLARGRSVSGLRLHARQFARERGDGLDALLGNLDQTVFGEPAYPTVEAKAAHLLYFVVKNHPFADGNKRTAAVVMETFLVLNGHALGASDAELVVAVQALAAGDLSEDELADWLRAHLAA